jgi:hypothetical protein
MKEDLLLSMLSPRVGASSALSPTPLSISLKTDNSLAFEADKKSLS